jgi:hypothetical protein
MKWAGVGPPAQVKTRLRSRSGVVLGGLSLNHGLCANLTGLGVSLVFLVSAVADVRQRRLGLLAPGRRFQKRQVSIVQRRDDVNFTWMHLPLRIKYHQRKTSVSNETC